MVILMSKPIYVPIAIENRTIDKLLNKFAIHMSLCALRLNEKLTQEQFSSVSGLSISTISSIETDGNPTLRSLIAYADVFGYELTLRKKDNDWKNSR